MNCKDFQRNLPVVPAEKLAAAEAHRRRCPVCHRLAERARSSLEVLARPASEVAPPAGFSSRVAAALPERPSAMTWATVRLLPMTAALALTLLGWCVWKTPSPTEIWSAEIWTAAGSDDVLAWVIESEEGAE